jgi:hypothetical protein
MILPDHIKDKLIDRYRKSVIKYSHNEHVKNGFKMIIYSLKHGESNKGGLLEFMKSNDEMDEHRKEKLLDVIPELKEVYEWAKS